MKRAFFAFIAVVQDKIATAGNAHNGLFQPAVGVMPPNGGALRSPNVINTLDIERDLPSGFQRYEVAFIIPVNRKIYQFIHQTNFQFFVPPRVLKSIKQALKNGRFSCFGQCSVIPETSVYLSE